jgi:hypothetical protein
MPVRSTAAPREVGPDRVELRREFAVVEHRNRVRVVEEVPQLVFDVPVVHVDRDRPQLERGEHPFEVFRRVEEVQRDVVAGTDAMRGEHVGETIRAGLEVGEGEPA